MKNLASQGRQACDFFSFCQNFGFPEKSSQEFHSQDSSKNDVKVRGGGRDGRKVQMW